MKISFILFSLLPLLGRGDSIDEVMRQQDENYNSILESFTNVAENISSHHLEMKHERAINEISPKTTTLVRRATASATPYSETLILWTAASRACAAATPTITISCATGGKIALMEKRGVTTCTSPSANTLKCTKAATAATAFVSVKCTGTYKVTASLPSERFTNCYSGIRGNVASHFINLQQVCAVKANVPKYTVVSSKSCTPASELVGANNVPFCTSESTQCTTTSKTACAINVNPVTISSPSTFSSLCIL